MRSNNYLLSICVVAALSSYSSVAHANNPSMGDGVWSGGLQMSGNGRNEMIQARLSQFNEISKLELRFNGWNGNHGRCTYYSTNYSTFQVIQSESIGDNCQSEVAVSYVSADHEEATVNVTGYVDELPLQTELPDPAAMPEPSEPEKAVDVLGIIPGVSEEEALSKVAELGYTELFEPTERLRTYSRGESFVDNLGREAHSDILTLTVLPTAEGNLVAAVHRAEQFPSNGVAADPYIKAFSDKYGDLDSGTIKYMYDGKRPEYGRGCIGQGIRTEDRPRGYTNTGGVDLMGHQIDVTCAYHVAYSLGGTYNGFVQGYALLSASPKVYLMALYPRWAEEKASALSALATSMTSTAAPEL